MKQPRPTDAEFAELARTRDAAVEAVVVAACAKAGISRSAATFHAHGLHGCYCACPDGPCQHMWDGPNQPIGLEEGEDPKNAACWSVTCSRCGQDAMSHDLRCMP